MAEGFFYAPDPSSQLACTIAGNIAMNSGGAHCLKYGVTTNNVIGLRMVLIDGTIVDIGGERADSAGLDLLGLVIGSEGQLGIVTEAIVRILRSAEGARPVLFGFETSAAAGATVAAIIARRHRPRRHGIHGQAGDRNLRGFRACRLSARRRRHADHRGRRIGRRDGRRAFAHHRHRPPAWREDDPRIEIGDGNGADLEGPQIGLRRDRPRRRLYLHGRHDPDRTTARGIATDLPRSSRATDCASPMSSTPATAISIRCSLQLQRRERSGPRRKSQAPRF